MEKRALIAIAISFIILLGWSYMFPPPERKQPETLPPAEVVDTGDTDRRPTREEQVPEAQPDVEAAPAEDVAQGENSTPLGAAAEEEVRVRTDFFEVVMSNRGGVVQSWRLLDYLDEDNQPLELVAGHTEARPLPLEVDLDDGSLAELINGALFEVTRKELPSRGEETGPAEQITFAWSDGRGLDVRKRLTFREGDWLVDADLEVLDRGRRLAARLAVGPGLAARAAVKGRRTYYYNGQGIWNQDGHVTHYKRKKLLDTDGGLSGGVRWAGLEDQYFASLIIPNDTGAQVRWRSIEVTPTEHEEGEEPEAKREAILSVAIPEDGARLFIGPKKYTLLAGLGDELEKAVWFSSNGLLYAISKVIFLTLIWIHDHVAPNYGLAIVLSTMLLRILLFPLNQYSMVKMKKTQVEMQRLAPKLKSIKAKYAKKKDAQSRQKMQQEQMELYKREGINPMGGVAGCLPMLAQFPILIGFYNMLTVAVELRGAPFFGWIQDLAHKDPYWILPLLMGVTMFAQQKMAMSRVTDPMQQQQQKFMMFMPVVFTWICLQMPAGMVLYWFVNNLLGIAQQWLVNRHTGRLATAAQKA